MKNKANLIFTSIVAPLLGFAGNQVAYILHDYYTQGEDLIDVFEKISQNFQSDLETTFFTIHFNKVSLIVGVSIFIFVWLITIYHIFDEKNYRPNEEFGSSRWGNAADIKPFVSNNEENNIILTETEKLSMEPRMKVTKSEDFNRNKNVVVIGGPGSGKTRYVVKPNAMQLNASKVITETKSVLPHELWWMYQKAGYRIKIFDLVTKKNTHYFNPFHYIDNETEILMVIDNFMKNTDGKIQKSGDPFWEKAEKALYSAIFAYLLDVGSEQDQNFPMVANLVRLGRSDGKKKSVLDILFEEYGELNPHTFAMKQWEIFKLAGSKTAQSILVSAGVRLAPFDIPEIQELMSKDTLELDTLGDQKTVLFICMPDTNDTYNFISSMLYQVMFEKLIQKADTVYKGALPYHLQIIGDEFANGGLIPDFDKKISTFRSRNISIIIILQQIAQIKNLYKDTWESILGSCDSLLYLGGNEQSTHEYISKILGKETIDMRKTGETKGRNGSMSLNYDKTGRSLLEPNEVASISGKKAIYKLRGVPPFLSNKYDLTKHFRYKSTADYDDSKWYNYNQMDLDETISTAEHFLKNTSEVDSLIITSNESS